MWLIVCRSYHQWRPEGAVWCQELNRPPLLLNECRTTSDRARERTPQETRTPENGVSSHGGGTVVCLMIFTVKGYDFFQILNWPLHLMLLVEEQSQYPGCTELSL